jgi:hypothetical protein
MSALAAITNPLPRGVYRIDLFSPSEQAPHVADGVPVFGRWRRANAHAVRVLEATAYHTEPVRSRVVFEVMGPPGAFPFGQLGPPLVAPPASVGDLPSFADIALFLLNPIGSLELAAVKAAAHFLADATAPELRGVRDAVSAAKANIAIVRATLEAVRNGTAPDNAAALAGAAGLIKETIAMLLKASAAVPLHAPGHLIDNVIAELRGMLKAIEEAPARAIRGAAAAAKGLVSDVVVPFELGGLGAALALVVGWYMLEGGKRSKTTDGLVIAGVAIAVLGGTTGVHNLLSPTPPKG